MTEERRGQRHPLRAGTRGGGRRAGDGIRGFATALATIGRLGFSYALIGIMGVFSTAGCASLPFFGPKTVKFEQADAKNPAVEILAFWQSSEGPGPKGVPIRGFGGQIYFFTQSKETPVAVDGSVRVYLFDDHGSVQEQSQPIATFDFDAAHWKNGAHNSPLGAGYSIFVPYPRNDFHQATCSLRIRFKPTIGPAIYSTPTTVVLSGPPAKSDNGGEAIIQPPNPQGQARAQRSQNGGAASLTTSVTFPPARVPNSRNVMPVTGTDTDTRMSLADDIAAPNDNRVQTADYTDDASAPQPSRFRLQSAQSDSSDRDGQ
jgi:hypothetical protein